MKTKYIDLFEKWSAKFNRTLQGAYDKGMETGKGFGKAAKDVMDYANRSISKEEFQVTAKAGFIDGRMHSEEIKFIIVYDPNTILKPISSIENYNELRNLEHLLPGAPGSLVIPIKEKMRLVNRVTPLDVNFLKIQAGVKNTKLFLCKSASFPASDTYDIRFSDRKSVEDFFAMLIQSILSSPEKGGPAKEGLFGHDVRRASLGLDPFIPGLTKEKQLVLDFIQKNVLSKDMREFIM
jgi:hypothetical protein